VPDPIFAMAAGCGAAPPPPAPGGGGRPAPRAACLRPVSAAFGGGVRRGDSRGSAARV